MEIPPSVGRWQRLRLALGLLMGWWLLCQPVGSQAREWWVAPDGSDTQSGERSAPMATVQGVLERDPGAHVRVLPGRYRLTRTLVLGAAHAGARIEAADPDAPPPLLDGSRRIEGLELQADGSWVADGVGSIDQLWVNGRRAQPSRSPRQDWFFALGPEGWGRDPATGRGVDLSRSALRVRSADVEALWSLPTAALRTIRLRAWHSWSVSQHPVHALRRNSDGSTTLLLGGQALWPFFHFGPVQRYQLENILPGADAPGTWSRGADGRLVYRPRPGEDIATAEMLAPALDVLVHVDGADGVVLRGLQFGHAGSAMPAEGARGVQAAAEAGAAIVIDRARGVRLERLAIVHVGGYAVWCRRACRDAVLARSLLEDLGAGGVRIGETVRVPAPADQSGAMVVEDTIVRDGGHVYPDGVGVLVGHAGGNRILHNDISRLLYSGISLGWVWGYGASLARDNRVEGNRVHHLGFGRLSDMGGIYTLGASPGTVIVDNEVHDILSYDLAGRGAWGIYLDEGSSDILVQGNLVYRARSGSLHLHYGRDNRIEGNVFAFGRDAQLERTRAEAVPALRLTRNVVLTNGAPLLAGHWTDSQVQADDNIYHDVSGAILKWGLLDWAQWQAIGRDKHSRRIDPGFVDALAGDFRLRPDAPARSLGIEPGARRFGVRGDPAWVALARKPVSDPMPDPAPPPPQAGLQLREDFEAQPLGSPPALAVVSVEGRGDAVAASAEQAATGRQSLKLQDAPGLAHAADPYLFYRPHHRFGRSVAEFSVWVGPGADFWHEWRDAASPYRVCASLSIHGGHLWAAGRNLGAVPPSQWLRLRIGAGVGARHDGTWRLEVLAGPIGERTVELPCRDREWQSLEWMGFASNGIAAGTIFLDDLLLDNLP